MPKLDLELARVTKITARRPGCTELQVELHGRTESAVAYPELCADLQAGDQVCVNTTAVKLQLGTGGVHFVLARAQPDEALESSPQPGHIIKLRYTPLQHRCLAVEERDSPHRQAIECCFNLDGLTVIVASLHSMIAPAAAGVIAATGRETCIAYVMTDTAALPIGFSRLVAQLKEAGLLTTTITVGQAFGGDLEAVNLYSGLLAAKAVVNAQVAIVAQGPGNVGTETEFGFGALAQGEWVNAAAALGGDAIAVPRISFADQRPRHHGLSEQTVTALGKVALARATIVVPMLPDVQANQIRQQLTRSGLTDKHTILAANGELGLAEAERRGIILSSMGRGVAEDRAFFLAAAAAGGAAVWRHAK